MRKDDVDRLIELRQADKVINNVQNVTSEVTPDVTHEVTGEVTCKTDPAAPHGFDRNASHAADRYVCECEGWEPVDAVDMTPDRVDETAKGEHMIDCTDEQLMEEVRRRGFVIRDAQIGKEWVGLTDDEIIKCFDSVAFGQVEDDLIINKRVNIFRAIHGIEAKLKEKNT